MSTIADELTNELKNGVNIDALLAAREALTETPEAAKFVWRAESEWKNGTHTQSAVEGFFGLGDEHRHLRRFSYDTDHPELFAAEDNGATPVELVLVALAGCPTGGIAAVASRRGIRLHSVTAKLEADMDIQGIMGIDADVRNGFDRIAVDYEIKADASDEDIAGLVAQSQKRSAVFDIITNPTNIDVKVNP